MTDALTLNVGIVVSMVSGILTIATQKNMNAMKSKTCDSCDESPFDSPFTQTILGSTAALIIWAIYLGEKRLANIRGSDYGHLEFLRSQASLKKQPINDMWVWCVPAVLEVLAGWCYSFALSLSDASTVLLQRSFTVVTTTLISSAWLKTRIEWGQWIGMVIVTIGTGSSVITSVFISPTNDIRSGLISAAIILSSCVISSVKMCYEERLLKEKRLAPFQMSGLVGLYSMGICGVIVILWPSKRSEFVQAVYQISHNSKLFTMSMAFLTSVSLYGCSSIIIAKFGSSILLTFLRCLRTVVIFAIDEMTTKPFNKRFYSNWLPLGATIGGIGVYSMFYPYLSGPPDYPGGDPLVEMESVNVSNLHHYSSLESDGATTG